MAVHAKGIHLSGVANDRFDHTLWQCFRNGNEGVPELIQECVHNMLHEKSEDILRGLYKSASFVVLAIAFKQTGNYISHQKELLQVVSLDERIIVETFLNLKNGGTVDFNLMSETLFTWSTKWISDNN